jgi:hypothetical protein
MTSIVQRRPKLVPDANPLASAFGLDPEYIDTIEIIFDGEKAHITIGLDMAWEDLAPILAKGCEEEKKLARSNFDFRDQ